MFGVFYGPVRKNREKQVFFVLIRIAIMDFRGIQLDKGAQSTILRPCTRTLQQAAAPYIRTVPNTSSLSLTKRHMYTPQYHHKWCCIAIVSFRGPFGLILSPYRHHTVFLYSSTNGYKMRTCKALWENCSRRHGVWNTHTNSRVGGI